MSELEVPKADVSTTERWSSLVRRARAAMEEFRTMVVQAQETKDEVAANICGEGVMFAIVVLDTVRARCPEALGPDAAGDIDPDPLTLEDTEHVMTEVDRRIYTMRKFVHPDAATGGEVTPNIVRNVPFGRA